MTHIRLLTPDEVFKLAPLGRQFYAESALPGEFNSEHFSASISALMSAGMAEVLIAENETGVVGTFGAMFSEDLLTGDLTATELFWFVSPEQRTCGLRLFVAFEELAATRGAKRIHMVHLTNHCDDKLDKFLTRRGYRLLEKAFTREVDWL